MDALRPRKGTLTLFGTGIAAAALAAVITPRGTTRATAARPTAARPDPRRAAPPRVAARAAAPRCIPESASAGGPRRPGNGGTLALSPSQGHAAVADADNDAVILLALTPGEVWAERTIRVGKSPAQVVLASDGRAFVTERGDNAVAVYDTRDGQLLCRTVVAPDPVGLALAPDERTVYVTSGISHTLTAVDTATFDTRWSTEIAREPRGVVLSRDGTQAFITHLAGNPLSAVHLSASGPRVVALADVPIPTEHGTRRVVRLPERHIIDFELEEKPDEVRLISVIAHHRARVRIPPNSIVLPPPPAVNPLPSQAWGAALDASGARVMVPFMVNRTGREVPQELRLPVYGGGSVSIAVGGGGEKVSLALGVFDVATQRWVSVTSPQLRERAASGGLAGAAHLRIPSAVTVRPDDGGLLVSAMGSNALAELGADGRASGAVSETVRAPCGVAATRDGRVLVYSQFDHALEVRSVTGTRRVSLGVATLPPEVARGRELFYSANDARISSGGLSCGGCHPDGRDDGLTWFLSQGPRQTPTLAGRLVAPFNWNGTQNTMEGNIVQTVHRLGGTGLPPADVSALAAFVTRGLRAPALDTVAKPGPSDEVRIARGREVFEGGAACAACHDPDREFTDGLSHELGGLRADERRRAFDTPSLRFVRDTAPYFHDGRYATLGELLRDSRHHMGHADQLSAADLDALTAYLETL